MVVVWMLEWPSTCCTYSRSARWDRKRVAKLWRRAMVDMLGSSAVDGVDEGEELPEVLPEDVNRVRRAPARRPEPAQERLEMVGELVEDDGSVGLIHRMIGYGWAHRSPFVSLLREDSI